MAAITADTVRIYRADVDPLFNDLPMKASTTIYEGAAMSDDSGNGQADALAVNETFLGFAEEQATCGTTAGATKIKTRQQGIVCDLPVTGVTGITDIGVAVYADNSGSFTLTSSASNVQIGKIVAYKTTGYADVFFQAAAVRSV